MFLRPCPSKSYADRPIEKDTRNDLGYVLLPAYKVLGMGGRVEPFKNHLGLNLEYKNKNKGLSTVAMRVWGQLKILLLIRPG